MYENMDFKEKVAKGFEVSVQTGDEVIGYLIHPSVVKRSFPYTNYDEDTGHTPVEKEKSLSSSP